MGFWFCCCSCFIQQHLSVASARRCTLDDSCSDTVACAVLPILLCRRGLKLDVADEDSDNKFREQYFNFYDARLMGVEWAKQPNVELTTEFFRLLALCHTVIPDGELVGGAQTCAGPAGILVGATL